MLLDRAPYEVFHGFSQSHVRCRRLGPPWLDDLLQANSGPPLKRQEAKRGIDKIDSAPWPKKRHHPCHGQDCKSTRAGAECRLVESDFVDRRFPTGQGATRSRVSQSKATESLMEFFDAEIENVFLSLTELQISKCVGELAAARQQRARHAFGPDQLLGAAREIPNCEYHLCEHRLVDGGNAVANAVDEPSIQAVREALWHFWVGDIAS